MRRNAIVGWVALVCLGATPTASASGGRTFTMVGLALTLRYPPSWRRFGLSRDTLSLMRPAMPVHGPIQPHGQARITVGPSSAPDRTEAAVIRYYAVDGVLGPIDRVDAGATTPCDHLARATVRQDVVPADNRAVTVRDIVSTVMICATPAGVVVGTASIWANDPHRMRADADLLTIMRSLRQAGPTVRR